MPIPEDQQPTIEQLIADIIRAEQTVRREKTDQLRDQILPPLNALGVANIEAAYSGYGDSGAINGVQYRDKAGVRVDRDAIPAQLKEQLENVLYEFLPAGFENNDGGQGTLTLDILTGRITLRHQENYTETRDSTSEFTL